MKNEECARSIAIVGGGLAGLGVLTGLLDFPPEHRQDWTINLYERRSTTGGIWHPQLNPPEPPELPETPMYPGLETISMAIGMTFPRRPMPPSTPLFAPSHVIDEYSAKHVQDLKLDQYIHTGNTVTSLRFDKSNASQPWILDIATADKATTTKQYSNVVVATGEAAFPKILHWPGEEVWLSASKDRKIMHSMWYRTPDIFKGKTVFVLGGDPSGLHVAKAAVATAFKVYHSFTEHAMETFFPKIVEGNYTRLKALIASFTSSAIMFDDGTTIDTPTETVIVQGTGYRRIYPFMGDLIRPVSGADYSYSDPTYHLECNEKYLRPLYNHLLPVWDEVPFGSIAFASQFPLFWATPGTYGQGIYLGHVFKDPQRMLPSRKQAMEEIVKDEQEQKEKGFDYTKMGRVRVPFESVHYVIDSMIDTVKSKSQYALPPWLNGRLFYDPWRNRAMSITMSLIVAWERARAEGVADSFSEGAVTEQDFVKALDRFVAWWEDRKARDEQGENAGEEEEERAEARKDQVHLELPSSSEE